MSKMYIMIPIIIGIILLSTANQIVGIQIDNQLVAAKNDCFERLVLEATIPFERTFRSIDTNSIRVCENLCIAEGEKCQSFSLGIHSKGNGTCQLSSIRIDQSSGRRPIGTIYDPDFDIYQRQTNCGINASNGQLPNEASYVGTSSSRFPSDRPTSSVTNSIRPTATSPQETTYSTSQPTYNERPSSTYSSSSVSEQSNSPEQSSSTYARPSSVDNPNPSNAYSPSTQYTLVSTAIGQYPQHKDPAENTFSTDDRYMGKPTSYGTSASSHPYDDSFPTNRPTTNKEQQYPSNDIHTYTSTTKDKFNFYHDIGPIYQYPMLYEHNYPQPNDNRNYPNVYAQNIPTIDGNYYRPTMSSSAFPTASTSSNVAGISIGTYSPSSSYDRPSQTVPTMMTNLGGGYSPIQGSNGYHQNPIMNGMTTTMMTTTGNDNNSYFTHGTSGGSSDKDRPMTNGDGTGEMMYNSNGSQYNGDYNNHRFDIGNSHSNGEMRPIETYFNPGDYFYEYMKPCFRRALAGKRISQRWVRRTLMCERIEDCQYECGHEKRFTCEGFNYRLDPSGRGQGVCELIDVPLSQMDIYSKHHSRDDNLLYHPDYDYYERDRNSCRPTTCRNCALSPVGPSAMDHYRPTTYRPPTDFKPYHEKPPYISGPDSSSGFGYGQDGFRPSYDPRPPIYENRPPPSYDNRPPPSYDNRPPPSYDNRPPPSYDNRPPPSYDNRPSVFEYMDRDDTYGPSSGFRPSSLDVDRYDKPVEFSRPGYQEVVIPVSNPGYSPPSNKRPFKSDDRRRPDDYIRIEDYRYDYKPNRYNNQYSNEYRPDYFSSYSVTGYKPAPHRQYPPPGPSIYLDRDPVPMPAPTSSNHHDKRPEYLPHTDKDMSWGSYGGTYGTTTNQYPTDYWGLRNTNQRKDDQHFNYFELGGSKYGPSGMDNSVWNYPGSNYNSDDRNWYKDKSDYGAPGNLWTRRPGQDECSVISSQGFRLHKGVVRYTYKVPTVTECERMCHSESKFRCVTYSYRYSTVERDNCQLCDRQINLLDFYADIEPDRDYDIYAMSDDPQMCSKAMTSSHRQQDNAQCFFRAIDTSRFFKSIVRDSLTVRSVGECEMECIKSSKFTCRAYSFRYGPKVIGSIIDNCQLSDWPVRDMDKSRHLVHDPAFDVFERASYGHGCEIQPITDEKHKKLCYLGYGSPSKLLSSAIKKVISVPTELDCKNECIRFRENTPFKCLSFSFGSQASTFNCEMSDLDQSELKLNVHYAHTTNERNYWLFAWNPFDWTCRDKVTTIGGNRVNNDRRMDVFNEPGQNTWTQYTVSGKACRAGYGCKRNSVTGFYACEIDGAEAGSWDYCCKTDHPCGYSHGFDYPWCFVGEGPDQWRTCSDRYYPANKKKTTNNNSVAAVIYTPKNKKKNDAYHQAAPRPGGLQNLEDVAAARLWPVTYLYSSGPPNSTELSNFVECDKNSNC